MGKGRYIKSQERSCLGKAKFESAEEAERFSNYQFGAYQCPICHKFHLTRSKAAVPRSIATTREPRLDSLNWNAAFEPKPRGIPSQQNSPAPPVDAPPEAETPPEPTSVRSGRIVQIRADRSAIVATDGRLVKTQRLPISHPFQVDLDVELTLDARPSIRRLLPRPEVREPDS